MLRVKQAEIRGGYIEGDLVILDAFGSVEQMQEVCALAHAGLLPRGVMLTGDDIGVAVAQVIFRLPNVSVEEAHTLAKEKVEEFDLVLGEFRRYRKFQMATNNFILQKKEAD